jgi:hypothetical protein
LYLAENHCPYGLYRGPFSIFAKMLTPTRLVICKYIVKPCMQFYLHFLPELNSTVKPETTVFGDGRFGLREDGLDEQESSIIVSPDVSLEVEATLFSKHQSNPIEPKSDILSSDICALICKQRRFREYKCRCKLTHCPSGAPW